MGFGRLAEFSGRVVSGGGEIEWCGRLGGVFAGRGVALRQAIKGIGYKKTYQLFAISCDYNDDATVR